jgi:UDP-3-O-[3-hydroxymyristoyl] N-acetylglucosamine deacetylase
MAGRRTLAREVSVEGVALHAGVPARLKLCPAVAGTGLVFRRSDLPGRAGIPALWSQVAETRLGTELRGADGASVAVVEHLLAALSGAEIDDCMIEVDGPEPPALDGDAFAFLQIIDWACVREQAGARAHLRVKRPVAVESEAASARLLPSTRCEYECEIDFASRAIGRQNFAFVFTPENFRREIAPARTFGFIEEAEKLRSLGYGRGASLENTLVIDKDVLVNPAQRRFPDEFVRHKILDAIGDLALAGAPIIARYQGRRPSHALNNVLLHALFSDSANYELTMT